MKTFRLIGLAVMAVLMSTSFTACSDDDDDEGGSGSSTLTTPEFADVSAKYEITNGGDIASIELTESGNYVVIKDTYLANTAVNNENKTFVPTPALNTRATAGIIKGTYIKISDTEFILEGFGSIVIEGNTDNAFSLQISEAGEEPYTVSANKTEIEYTDAKSQLLCRTWNIDKVKLQMNVYGMGTKYNETMSANQYIELWEGLINKIKEIEAELDDEEDEDYYEDEEDDYSYLIPTVNPEQIIITRAGSYMVTYEGDQLAISTWGWSNVDAGEFRYSWDYDYLYDPEYSNKCNVTIDGSSFILSEINHEEVDEEEGITYMTVTSTYYCSEAK